MKIFTALFQIARLQENKAARKSSPPRDLVTSRPAKGFTLIELLVSITLIAIVSGFAVPGLYGSYQHQQMLNAANEIISTAKLARSKALANYQGQYTVTPANGGPISSCDATHAYVDGYSLSIGVDKTSYKVLPTFQNNPSLTCQIPSSPAAISSKKIPTPISVNSAPDFPLKYNTVSGKFSLAANSTAQVDLISNGYLGNFHYYICITQNSMYAQATVC